MDSCPTGKIAALTAACQKHKADWKVALSHIGYKQQYLFIHTFPTYLPAYLPTYIHTYIHTFHTYIPTYGHSYIATYLHTDIPTYPHTYIRTYLYTYIHTCIHTDKHTYTYIYICIHIYIYMLAPPLIHMFWPLQPTQAGFPSASHEKSSLWVQGYTISFSHTMPHLDVLDIWGSSFKSFQKSFKFETQPQIEDWRLSERLCWNLQSSI